MPEIQDIFQDFGEAYRRSHGLSFAQSKAMSAIQRCRTAELGYHLDACESCGCVEISYNSCRNRHCPKCQTLAKEHWIDGQKHNLLHVLPPGFTKIRHYGFLASRNKTKKLTLCKKLTRTSIVSKEKASTIDLLTKMFGRDFSLCPHCGNVRHPRALSPPACA